MSNVPFLNNAKIAYGPETWLRHTLLPPSYLLYKPELDAGQFFGPDPTRRKASMAESNLRIFLPFLLTVLANVLI